MPKPSEPLRLETYTFRDELIWHVGLLEEHLRLPSIERLDVSQLTTAALDDELISLARLAFRRSTQPAQRTLTRTMPHRAEFSADGRHITERAG